MSRPQDKGKYRRWTPEEDSQLKKLYQEKTLYELADIFNRGWNKVGRRAMRLGIKKSKEALSKEIQKATKETFRKGRNHRGQNNPRWKGGPKAIREQKILNGEINTDKTMLGKSAVQKGKILENFVVEKLRTLGVDTNARRTKGSGGYQERGDIYNGLGLNIECKNQKNFKLKKFWAQTLKDSEMTHTIPILIWHPPHLPLENSAVIMEIEYALDLLKRSQEPKIKEPDRETSYKLKRLIQAAKDLLKELES